MARMTLKAVHGDGERRQLPLRERIIDENLGGYRHVPEPHARLRSATADTEALEQRTAPAKDRHDDDAGHAQPDARRQRRRPNASEHDDELSDAAWLYAWASADLRASRGVAGRTSQRGRSKPLGSSVNASDVGTEMRRR
jgi:hypothetical protein